MRNLLDLLGRESKKFEDQQRHIHRIQEEKEKIQNEKEQKILEQQRKQRQYHTENLVKSGLCKNFREYSEKIKHELAKLEEFRYYPFYTMGDSRRFSSDHKKSSRKKNLNIDIDEKGVYLEAKTVYERIITCGHYGSFGGGGSYTHGDSKYYTTYYRKFYFDPNSFTQNAIDVCLKFVLFRKWRLPFKWGRFSHPS